MEYVVFSKEVLKLSCALVMMDIKEDSAAFGTLANQILVNMVVLVHQTMEQQLVHVSDIGNNHRVKNVVVQHQQLQVYQECHVQHQVPVSVLTTTSQTWQKGFVRKTLHTILWKSIARFTNLV